MNLLHGALGGRYRLGALLAVGGQGSVYAAVDDRDGRELVLKLALAPGDVHVRLAADRQLALAEHPALGPHLVPVWDVGTWGDRGFVVLERLERTLAELPERAHPAVLRALLAAAVALEAAGQVHGDLKPSNVFVREDEDGPAVLLGDLWSGEPPAPLSPGFSAPELWLGAAPTAATDRYALGATLWAVLAGGPPPAALAGPRAVRPGRAEVREARLPAPWDGILPALLDPAPRTRPSPRDVLAALDGGRWRPRRRWVGVAGAAACVGLALGAWAWWAETEATGPVCPPGFAADRGACRAADGRVVVLVPAGTYVQGADEEDRRFATDAVQRTVTLTRPVWFRTTEVTQREVRDLTGEHPVRDRQEDIAQLGPVPCRIWQGHRTTGDDLPVACVSWFDAVRYANAASEHDGLAPAYRIDGDGSVEWDRDADGWRLPTEAEWEWAARGADAAQTWAGARSRDEICTHANVRAEDAPQHWGNEVPCDDGAPVLARVGSYQPNALGLYDMLGNVDEWVWDRWEDRTPAPVVDPVGATLGAMRVYRGPSWNQVARPVSARYAGDPKGFGLNGGFRLVRNAPPGRAAR